MLIIGQSADAAIINAASGRRRATLSGQVKITTTTSGQRQIAIKIDPDVTTAFRLDVLYPSDSVTPVAFGGFNTLLQNEAIVYVEPYGMAGGGASILPMAGPKGTVDGLISNIEGRYQFPPSATPQDAVPNRPDGGSDLFTLFFIDNDPGRDKTFRILGVGTEGVPPSLSSFVADNYLDVLVDDPADPLFGQIVRLGGEEIDGATIFVPGEARGDGTGGVPLPPAVWSGLVGAGTVWAARRKRG